MSMKQMQIRRESIARRTRCLLSIACLVLASAPAAGAGPDQSAAVATAKRPAGGIVFVRGVYNPDDTARSRSLFRVDADGDTVVRLTPSVEGSYDSRPTWGPRGRRIAFSRYDADTGRHHIHIVPWQGGRSRRITSGDRNYDDPSWNARRNLIAFVSSRAGEGDCLSLVDPGGQGQLDLFCPPDGSDGRPGFLDRPVWSADGRSLFVQAGYFEGSLEYVWHSFVYRVEVDTGVAELLTDHVFEDSHWLTFAPDGSHGIYHEKSFFSSSTMVKVDFATDELVSMGEGYAPVYSRDGSRIAFSRRMLTGSPPYEPINSLFVMDADGSNMRRLKSEQGDYVQYKAQAWSVDGTRVLFNRIVLEPGEFISRNHMRIIDIDTRAVVQLPAGSAGPESWHDGGVNRGGND